MNVGREILALSVDVLPTAEKVGTDRCEVAELDARLAVNSGRFPMAEKQMKSMTVETMIASQPMVIPAADNEP